jgi:Arc/MetJ-type ribon-helix-helix transcriptional regulator
MAETMAMTIHVSPETREYIRKKVEDGEYASESDLIADRIDLMRDEEEDVRQWEQDNVVAAYDELRADPSSEVTLEQLQANLSAARRQRQSRSAA